MIDLIKQVDYKSRHIKGKKPWAIAQEQQQRRETEELINEHRQTNKEHE